MRVDCWCQLLPRVLVVPCLSEVLQQSLVATGRMYPSWITPSVLIMPTLTKSCSGVHALTMRGSAPAHVLIFFGFSRTALHLHAGENNLKSIYTLVPMI